MSWQEIQTLRKAGRLEEAHNIALALLATSPEDFKVRSQLEWVFFEYIKQIVTSLEEGLKKSQPVDSARIEALMIWMREYYRLRPSKPGMACSVILGQLVKVGAHLPTFPEIIQWVGQDGLRAEDWRPNSWHGKAYPSLAINIARALCKWAKARPDAGEKQLAVVLDWARRVRESSQNDDALWLSWDMAILLRQMGDFHQAAELLAGVIKAKRNEFWVWAEAGRLYQSEQPELALACYCRALECPADAKFLVRAHCDLAGLLMEQSDYAQASREIAATLEIRQAQGWPPGREMEALLVSSWYDPLAEGAEDPQRFYARHSAAALALCFDVVETRQATSLGVLIPHRPADQPTARKPKPLSLFAVKDDSGKAWTLVSPGAGRLKPETGAPLTVVIGSQHGEERQTLVHVARRPEGQPWDCLEPAHGAVVREPSDTRSMRVFCSATGEEMDADAPADCALGVGDSVSFGLVRNPKNDRLNAFNLQRSELADPAVKRFTGVLRRNAKGFAFVEDAFVAPFLVASVDASVSNVVALSVYGKHPKENKRTWRAITLQAAD